MSNSRHSDSAGRHLDAAGKAIQRQAAEWLALRQARGFTLSQQADFVEWMARDPRHAAMYAEVESSWRMFDRLRSFPHSVDLAADADLLAPKIARRRTRAALFPVALAAAAAIALGGSLWMARSRLTDAPAPARSLLAGESRFLRLPDGSTVELNADSVVTENFTAQERRVQLVRGEAHFSVVKDAARVFIVEADGVAVQAIGTAFNVRLQAKKIEVLVTEGTVQIAPPTPSEAAAASPVAAVPAAITNRAAVLTAGQRAVVPATVGAWVTAPVVETLAPADIELALAWQNNRINFEAIPLAEVVARLNRYSALNPGAPRLTIRDTSLGTLRISGRVRSDNIESFVEALESSFGVAADRLGAGEIVLRPSERE